MKARLQALGAKFAALQQREKALIAVASVSVIGLGGYTLWAEPPMLRAAALRKQIAQQKTDMQNLQAQLVVMGTQVRDPDAPNRAALKEIMGRLDAVDRSLRGYENTLVAPERMPQLLQSLVSRHKGLELLSLETLPPQPLLAPAAKPEAKADGKTEAKGPEAKGTEAKAPAVPAAKGNNIHKHGIEIRMAGNYLDLLAYVAELDGLPQKLLWGAMSLEVTAYPRSELSLTVYTLSLDPTWMVV